MFFKHSNFANKDVTTLCMLILSKPNQINGNKTINISLKIKIYSKCPL